MIPLRHRHSVSLVILVVLGLALVATPVLAATKTVYEVVLERSPTPPAIGDLDRLPLLVGKSIVVVQESEHGRPVYVLKASPFETFAEARQILRTLAERYPDARAERVRIAAGPVRAADLVAGKVTPALLDDWLGKGREAMIDGDLATAGVYLARIVEVAPASKAARQAREWLGVVAERQGRARRSREIYEDFLRRYPKGEDSDRVRQRLDTLVESRAADREPLPRSRPRKETSDVLGSLSQFVTRDVTYVDGENVGAVSMLITDADLTARASRGRYDLRAQFDLSHRRIFEGRSRDRDRLRLNDLYLDIQDRRWRSSLTIGRQRHSSGGVLGRFDGLLIGHQYNADWHFNAVVGRPADINDSSDSNRLLYGVSADGGTFARHWDVNAYLIRQTADGMVDREAVGGELRYIRDRQSHLLLLDYDLAYRTLNDALFDAHWFRPDGATFNASLAYRAAPLLVTENALIGQGASSVAELLQRFSEDEVRQLARDRTARLSSFSLSASRPYRDRWQLSADFNLSRLSGTPASGGVSAVPSNGNEYLYSLQATGSDLFRKGDITTFMLRYNDLAAVDILSLDVNSRFPVDDRLRVEPRLGIDYRRGSSTTVDSLSLRPNLRADYRWRRHIGFDAELGFVWTDELGAGSGSSLDIAFELGYRIDF